MLSIGIGEIQKKSSIFSNLNETMQIIDKRKKRVLAIVYPIQNVSVVDNLAGKYKKRVETSNTSLEDIKKTAMQIAMKEKYGISS